MSIKSAKQHQCKSNLFGEVLALFQSLDKQMEYPNCEGYADEARAVLNAELRFYGLLSKYERDSDK